MIMLIHKWSKHWHPIMYNQLAQVRCHDNRAYTAAYLAMQTVAGIMLLQSGDAPMRLGKVSERWGRLSPSSSNTASVAKYVCPILFDMVAYCQRAVAQW